MMGNQESNQVATEGNGEQYNENPYNEEQDVEKAIQSNPFLRDLDSYVKKELQ